MLVNFPHSFCRIGTEEIEIPGFATISCSAFKDAATLEIKDIMKQAQLFDTHI
jgi:hypothetical protein